MAELLTVARPYAEAAFKLATGGGDVGANLASWSDALSRLAAITARPEISAVLGNPKVSTDQLVQLISDAAGSLSAEQKNFLVVVAQQERIEAMGQVAEHFALLRNRHEAKLEAEITTAYPLSDTQLKEIVAVLSSKYGKTINPTVKVDHALIGGVSIRVGDEVTDVSVRGKLAQLQAGLMA